MKNAPTQSKPVSYLADSTVYIHKSVPDIYCMNTKAGHMYTDVSAPVITGFYNLHTVSMERFRIF